MRIARRQFLASSSAGIAAATGVGKRALALAAPQGSSNLAVGTPINTETQTIIRRENCSFANEMLRLLEADVEDGIVPADCEKVHHCPLCDQDIRVQLPRATDRRA